MKRYKIKVIKNLAAGLAVFLFLLVPTSFTFADIVSGNGVGGIGSGNGTGAPAGSYAVQNPLGVNSFCGLIKALLGAAIQIGIPIAVLFIVFAGLKFVLARGNSEALVSARQNFLYTIIGIGIFLGAWLLAMVIANTVNTLSAGSGSQQAISCQ